MKLIPSTPRDRAALVATLVVLAHLPSFARPLLDSDEAVYASIAALVEAGGRLYSEGGVDNKFPGIYFTYAAVFELFGRYSMQAVHALALGVVLASAFILGRIAARVRGERAGLFAALFYGLLTTFYYPKMLAANTEVFMTLPLAASVLLSLPSRTGRAASFLALFGAGALIGVAAMYRQLAGLNLAVSCLAPLLLNRTQPLFRRLVQATAPPLGFAAAFGALAGVFALQDNLRDFWFWTVAVTTTRYLPRGWGYTWPWRPILAIVGVMIVPWALTALRAKSRWRQCSTPELLVWIWLPAGVLAILVLWRFHPHYIIHAVAPLSVLAGLELDQRLEEASGRARKRLVQVTTTLMALPTVIYFVVALLLEPVAGGFAPPRPDYPRVARAIREMTTPDQRVFVWGAYAALYVLSDRLPASRFVGFLRGCSRHPAARPEACWDSGPETWPILREDLLRAPAELIVDTSPADWGGFKAFPMRAFPVLQGIVDTDYELAGTVEGVDIYRRKPTAAR